MPKRAAALALLVVSLAAGCAPEAAPPPQSAAAASQGAPAAGAPHAGAAGVAWAGFDATTFAKAKAEGRFVILDGAAEWCHFCHVMEEKTYADPRVQALLSKHFIAAKVDIDQRPDIEERYGDWGWPATIIFSPDGDELGKYRGFIPPDDFLEILSGVALGKAKPVTDAAPPAPVAKAPLSDEALEIIRRFTDLELEEFWDPKEGGWGREPKVPIGWNALYALSHASEPRLRDHALVLLDRQQKLIDPVWGGIYQYSVAPDWDHPHFEKLVFWNAPAMAAYAEAFALTKDDRHRARANDLRRWFDRFMTSPEGTFYATQDADLNSHPASVPFAPTSPRGAGAFMKGDEYYRLGDAERRALGVPRIDPNEYADDNGLAIFAFATLGLHTRDASATAAAERAAARILETHRVGQGGLSHLPGEARGSKVHLADCAAMGLGLVRLFDATSDKRWLVEARRIADFVERSHYDLDRGGFFSSTRDENAVGVFRVRRKAFDENVLALRFFARLAIAEGKPASVDVIERSLAAIATPEDLKGRGKFLGDFLSLLDEVKAFRRLPAAPVPPTPTVTPKKPARDPFREIL